MEYIKLVFVCALALTSYGLMAMIVGNIFSEFKEEVAAYGWFWAFMRSIWLLLAYGLIIGAAALTINPIIAKMIPWS